MIVLLLLLSWKLGLSRLENLFLSGLNQFADRPEQLVEFLTLLAKAKSSALFITDEHPSLISSDIVALSDKLELPIIEFQEDIPYAVIMDTINKLTILEFRHAINGLWLNRLLLKIFLLKIVWMFCTRLILNSSTSCKFLC